MTPAILQALTEAARMQDVLAIGFICLGFAVLLGALAGVRRL